MRNGWLVGGLVEEVQRYDGVKDKWMKGCEVTETCMEGDSRATGVQCYMVQI